MMENHNWTGGGTLDIKGNAHAPYINTVLLPLGTHPENYWNPPHLHPSKPNYLWLEAGTNFGITYANGPVGSDAQSTTDHLVTYLSNAGYTWKAYAEPRADTDPCPVNNWLNPMVFFKDVTDNENRNSPNCIAHMRPYSELATDLATEPSTPNYVFITPSLCHSMHTACSNDNQIAAGDTWLSQNVPMILNSPAFQDGVLFVLFDEALAGDGPIPLLVLSPFAKTGYANTISYSHGSTLRTVQEIFNLTPLLGAAAEATDLSDLFTEFP